MSEATTPANPTDQIATVAARPVVAPDAQRYDWREDLDMATDYGSTMSLDAAARVTACIERLEAERDALLAEHEAVTRLAVSWDIGLGVRGASEAVLAARDNAERVIRR